MMMNKQLHTTLACALLFSSAHAQSDRVIGGNTASEGQFPWMVEMRFLDDEHLCGGTLIHPQWVLTAGHCALVGEDANMRLIANSVINAQGLAGPNAEELQVDLIVYHPDYDGENGPDLALIRLAQSASAAPVVVLPPAQAALLANGDSALVLGWGTADTSTLMMSDSLQYAAVSLVDHGTCQALYANASYDFFGLNGTPGLICAGAFEGNSLTGTGNGDSGGPLLVMHQGQWKQVGVVYGGEGSHVTEEHPGIFTTTAHNWEWIQSVIGTASVHDNAMLGNTPTIRPLHDHITIAFAALPAEPWQVELYGTDGRLLIGSTLQRHSEHTLPWPTGHTALLIRVRDARGMQVHAQMLVRPT